MRILDENEQNDLWKSSHEELKSAPLPEREPRTYGFCVFANVPRNIDDLDIQHRNTSKIANISLDVCNKSLALLRLRLGVIRLRKLPQIKLGSAH